VAAAGQFSWPPPGRFVAGYGQIPMSVVNVCEAPIVLKTKRTYG
jgi:hypothetical protein